MSIDDPMVPYSSIPMPYPGQGALLSDWPQAYCQQVSFNSARLCTHFLAVIVSIER